MIFAEVDECTERHPEHPHGHKNLPQRLPRPAACCTQGNRWDHSQQFTIFVSRVKLLGSTSSTSGTDKGKIHACLKDYYPKIDGSLLRFFTTPVYMVVYIIPNNETRSTPRYRNMCSLCRLNISTIGLCI